jgi:hypothetical protein
MRTLKYSFFVLLLSLSFTSCVDDFLEVDNSKVAIPDSIVFSDPTYLQMLIEDIYAKMGDDRSYRNRADYYYHANTDIERNKSISITTTTNASNGAGFAYFDYNNSDSNIGLEEVWMAIYGNINSCNQLIENIPTYADPAKNKTLGVLYAEALALRSFFYYDLITWWGDVPARWIADDNTYQPTNREEIYDHILADLSKAKEYLKDGDVTSVTHPTLAGIQAFRARVALSAAGYAQRPLSQLSLYESNGTQNAYAFVGRVGAEKRTEYYQIAYDECTDIISRGDAAGKLLPSFQDVFLAISSGETNPTKTESLWEMRYRNQIVKGWGLRHDADTYTDRVTGDRGFVVGSLWYDYDAADTRRDVSVAPWYWVGAAGKEALTPSKINNLYFAKLRPEWAKGNTDMRADKNGDVMRGKVIVRYADVLLMHAEACLALEKTAEGQTSFDKVRNRAYGGTAPAMALTLDNLMEERKLEFVGEQIRKRDLIRWGKLKEAMDISVQKCIDLQSAHNGEASSVYDYSDVPKKVWYRLSPTKNDPVTGKPVMEFYGMNRGEILPDGEETPTGDGWQSTSMWSTSSLAGSTAYYEKLFYVSSVNPDLHSLLPISPQVIGASYGKLKNLYGY